MNVMAGAVTVALLRSVWQDALVAAGFTAALTLVRPRSAQARYLMACGALALMAILPITTAVGIYAHGADVALDLHATLARMASVAVVPSAAKGSASQPAPLTSWTAVVQTWAFSVWLIGVVVGSLRLVASGLHAASLKQGCSDADAALRATVSRIATAMHITRPVTVRVTPSTDGAATLGWVRPMILLAPAAALGLTPMQLEAVIAHELAHIRRHDYLVNLLQLAVETVFFYHPAVWWVSHRMRVERELCCDDAAVEACGDAHAYARALATMAGALPRPAIAAAGGSLRARIERLLGVTSARAWSSPRAGLTAITLAVGLVAGAAWVHAQQAPPAATTPAAAGNVTLSGVVYAPFGEPAENTPITLSSHDTGVVRTSTTDGSGRYRFENLPRGHYSLTTAITDSVLPAVIDLTPGQARVVNVQLGVDDVALDVRVCARCGESATASAPPSASAPGIPQNGVIVAAEPAEGWDAFNGIRRAYPQALAANRVEGSVIVEGRIAGNGTIEGVHARVLNARARGRSSTCDVDSSCAPALAAAALAMVQQQHWRPARVHGTPVDVPLHVTVEYTLAGD